MAYVSPEGGWFSDARVGVEGWAVEKAVADNTTATIIDTNAW
jgi:hypothetical protein